MTLEAWRVLVAAALLAALAAYAALRRRRPAFAPALPRVPDGALALAAPLTAVYFTSRLCSECKETPDIVREAAPEVALVEISVHDKPALARALGIEETPTLLLVDDAGRIRYARAGNPTPAELWTYVRECWDSLDVPRVPA